MTIKKSKIGDELALVLIVLELNIPMSSIAERFVLGPATSAQSIMLF